MDKTCATILKAYNELYQVIHHGGVDETNEICVRITTGGLSENDRRCGRLNVVKRYDGEPQDSALRHRHECLENFSVTLESRDVQDCTNPDDRIYQAGLDEKKEDLLHSRSWTSAAHMFSYQPTVLPTHSHPPR